jgi:hypothetical protein
MDGTPNPDFIAGKDSGTLQIAGYVSQAQWNEIELTWAKNVPVTFNLAVTEGLGTDASWSGLVMLSSVEVTPTEDGAWEFTLSGDISGAVTYTPSAP